MPCFAGYLSHELLVDIDDPGHLVVVSQWASQSMPTSPVGSTPNTRMPTSRTTWSPSLDGASSPHARVADPTANPQALLVLANLGRPRRPSGAAVASAEPIMPDVTVASAQLAEVVDQPVARGDLADLRRLQRASAHAAHAVLAGEPLDCAELNALAAGSHARTELSVTDGVPRRQLIWTDTSLAAALARRLIDELNALEPDRLRRCARPQCDLLFYDITRSRTRRWHAEDPSGWRERQRAHRRRTSS